jgi:CheY-like chemotaxis protein
MPEMDGLQATAKIRALGDKFAKLPIIALTANATRGVREIFLKSGLDDYVSKPIELDKLSAILRKWLPYEKIEERGGAMPGKAAVKQAAERAKREESAGSFWKSVAATGYINAEVGKNRVAGIEEMYGEALGLFYGKLPADCAALEKFLAGKDAESLTILAHGMKSSLSTIGAMALSETARQIEKASKRQDLLFCEDIMPSFLSKLRDLYAKLGAICENGEGDGEGGRAESGGIDIKEYASAALAAAEAYDGEQALEAVGKLLKRDFGEEVNKLLKSAQTALRSYEFGEAAEILKKVTGIY